MIKTIYLPYEKENAFGLMVVDNSMFNYKVSLQEGDLVLCDKDAKVESGQLCSGLVKGETVIRLYKENDDGNFLLDGELNISCADAASEKFKIVFIMKTI